MPAQERFPGADRGALGELQDTIRTTLEAAVARGTRENTVTAATKFIEYVMRDLGVGDLRELFTASPIREWSGGEREWRTTMMMGYAARVTESHKRTKTTQTYVRQVTVWWRNMTGTDLWDPSYRSGLTLYYRGLKKMKRECRDPRDGFSRDDIVALNKNTVVGNPAVKGKRDTVEETELANIRAVREVAWQLLFRLGELCPQGPEGWDPTLRLTRADVEVVRDREGRITEVTFPPPLGKTSTDLARHRISAVYDEAAPVNAARALVALLEKDPVPEGKRATTPLFRDTRPGHGHNGPLRADRVMNMDKRIMAECLGRRVKASDGNERSHKYGGHSYRIGGAVALMRAGCPVLTLQGMGRWVSDCYTLYLRVGREVMHNWQRSIGRAEAAEAERRGGGAGRGPEQGARGFPQGKVGGQTEVWPGRP